MISDFHHLTWEAITDYAIANDWSACRTESQDKITWEKQELAFVQCDDTGTAAAVAMKELAIHALALDLVKSVERILVEIAANGDTVLPGSELH